MSSAQPKFNRHDRVVVNNQPGAIIKSRFDGTNFYYKIELDGNEEDDFAEELEDVKESEIKAATAGIPSATAGIPLSTQINDLIQFCNNINTVYCTGHATFNNFSGYTDPIRIAMSDEEIRNLSSHFDTFIKELTSFT
jgi:hypothetical protein